jgi:hypothetical protein
MAKAIKNALKQRQLLRKSAGESIAFNRSTRLLLANKPIRGNFSNLLKFRPHDTKAKTAIMKQYERPELLKKESPASSELLLTVKNIELDVEKLKKVITNIQTVVKGFKNG